MMKISSKNALIINCPQCGEYVEWTASNRFRPFCSERCKLLDLGQWASESYRIPTDTKKEDKTDDSY